MNATLTSNTLKTTITAMFVGLVIGLPSPANAAIADGYLDFTKEYTDMDNIKYAAKPAEPQSDLTAKKIFVASDPYAVNVNGVNKAVSLGGKPRTYDFVSNPLVNPNTGVADAATLMATNPVGAWLLSGAKITNVGIPGHIEKQSNRLVLGTLVGDLPTAGGKCRAQLASFPVPNRKKVYWDIIVQLGSTDRPWEFTAPSVSPVLITQVKADDAQNPGISIYADTQAADIDPVTKTMPPPTRLLLSFTWRGGKAIKCFNVGKAFYISPNVPVKIVMEAFLDERESNFINPDDPASGHGYWKVWVNGSMVVNLQGATLPSVFNAGKTPGVHTWDIDSYMYNDPCPNTLSRFTYWNRAKMLVDPI